MKQTVKRFINKNWDKLTNELLPLFFAVAASQLTVEDFDKLVFTLEKADIYTKSARLEAFGQLVDDYADLHNLSIEEIEEILYVVHDMGLSQEDRRTYMLEQQV